MRTVTSKLRIELKGGDLLTEELRDKIINVGRIKCTGSKEELSFAFDSLFASTGYSYATVLAGIRTRMYEYLYSPLDTYPEGFSWRESYMEELIPKCFGITLEEFRSLTSIGSKETASSEEQALWDLERGELINSSKLRVAEIELKGGLKE
jgi:hypothetical protein